jgi:glycerophosphoryl diester phosphodiesterase
MTHDLRRRILLVCIALAATACNGDDEPASEADATVADGAEDPSADTEAPDATADGADDGDAIDAPDLTDAPELPARTGRFYEDRVLNIAHRGGGRLAPEETLVAFERAVEVGADVLELDVHATSDGALVVMHDDEVDRTTDGSGPIAEMTLEAVRLLDAGYQFTPDDGDTYPYRGQGVVVPTFEEVLAAFPEMYFVVEIKPPNPDLADDVVTAIAAAGLRDRVAVSSFHDTVIAAVREQDPELLTGLSPLEVFNYLRLSLSEEASWTPPGELLQVPPVQGTYEFADAEEVAKAHRLGLRVHIWTINDRDTMLELIDLGVDGIMTDDPQLLAEVLAETE